MEPNRIFISGGEMLRIEDSATIPAGGEEKISNAQLEKFHEEVHRKWTSRTWASHRKKQKK